MSFLLATVIGGLLAAVVWRLPAWMRASTEKQKMFNDATSQFYDEAEKILRDDTAPLRVVGFLNSISNALDDPRIIRQIMWKMMIGSLREDASHPPDSMRRFLGELKSMSEPQQRVFASAMAHAFLANALRAGLIGELFIRFVFPSQKAQPETVPDFTR